MTVPGTRVADAEVLCLDVNETLADLSPLAHRLVAVGARSELLPLWFAQTLRDGFALAASGGFASFPTVAAEVLAGLLEPACGEAAVDAAVEHVVAGFPELPVHPDVGPGLRALAAAGRRLVPLSNGPAATTRSVLDRAGLPDVVEAVLSVDDAGRWKPHPDAYAHAVTVCGVPPGRIAMVASHPWDLAGARAAGLSTVWVDRTGSARWPGSFAPPDVRVRGLVELAEVTPARAG